MADAYAIAPSPPQVLDKHVAEIRRLAKRTVEDIVEIGCRLTECKKLVGHGNWSTWCEQEFGWSEATALNFMRAYELSKSRNFQDLNVGISTLYLLARPSVPESARNEVLDRVAAGEPVSVAGVKRTIQERKRPVTSDSVPHRRPAGSAAAVTGLQLADLWHRASSAERVRFLDQIGSQALAAHIPAAWERTLGPRPAALPSPSPMPAMPADTEDDLDIPAPLRRVH
jgi:hypothetical protein